MRRLLPFVLAAMAVGAAQASTLSEEKRFEIYPRGGQDFEVIRQQQMGATELWCAAASYVEARRGLPETTLIYVRQPLARSATVQGRQSVLFTLDNAGLPPPDPSQRTLTVDVPGAMVKSAVARRFCRDAFTRSTK